MAQPADTEGGTAAPLADNLPPIVTHPDTQTNQATHPLVFSAADGNAISVADADAGTDDIAVDLSVDGGTLTLATTEGLTLVNGDGTDSVGMRGPVSAINAALDGITYRSMVVGSFAVDIIADDLGHHGDGGPRIGTALVHLEVIDITPPVLTSPDEVTAHTTSDSSGANVSFDASATDDVGPNPTPVDCGIRPGQFLPIGRYSFVCTARDGAGNITSRPLPVTVVDGHAPTMASPPDITVTAEDGADTHPVLFEVPDADDNSREVDVTCTHESGTHFTVGSHTVACTATDPSGNATAEDFTVTVLAASATLPATGSHTRELAGAGMVLLALGGLALALSRRRLGLGT
jgi:LPXTG-motif cell wall-anchored protein